MKTRHLLMALALPVAFASCTDDDLVSNGQNNELANRKVVGNISFKSPIDSRVVFDKTAKELRWTEEDALGAALMDELIANPVENATDPSTNYTLSNKLYSNYLYTVDAEGNFSNNNALLVEGNYFVYAQFNKDQRRSGLAYNIASTQTSGEDGYSAWYKNQMFMDHIFVTHGNLAPALDMKGVFGRTALMLNYEGADNTLVIDKIVVTDLNTRSGGFGTSGSFMPANVTKDKYEAFGADDVVAVEGSGYSKDNYEAGAGSNAAQVMNIYKKARADKGTKFNLKTGKSLNSPILKDFFEAGIKVPSMTMEFSKPAASVNSYMINPISETRTAENLKIEIYTNRGIVTLAGEESLMNAEMNFAGTYNVTAGEGAGAETKTYYGKDYAEITEDMSTLTKAAADIKFDSGIDAAFVKGLKADQLQIVTINFKDNAVLVPYELKVSSTTELEKYLKEWYSGKKDRVVGVPAGEQGTVRNNLVKVIVEEGKTVEISEYVMSFIANTTENPVLTFTGDVVIPADAAATTLNAVKRAEGATYGTAAELNITNLGTQNWTAAGAFDKILNKGTLTVGTGAANETATYNAGEALVNEGTLTINKALENACAVYNVGTLTLNGDVTTLLNGVAKAEFEAKEIVGAAVATLNSEVEVKTLENYAILNVAGGVVEKLANFNTVNVNGGMTITGNSENSGEIVVAEGSRLNVCAQFENEAGAKLTNNGELVTSTSNGKFWNYGEVINNKDISSNLDGAAFYNYGEMQINGNTITLISENREGAEIIVADNTATLNIPTADVNVGKVTFIINEENDMAAIPTCANSLRITVDNVNLQKANSIKHIEFRNAKGMTINASSEDFNNVTFNADGATAKVKFNIFGSLIANETLKVSENAQIIINDIMTYSGKVSGLKNDGQMYVIGTLALTKINYPGDDNLAFIGDVHCTGGGVSNIEWGSGDTETIVGKAEELNNKLTSGSTVVLANDMTMTKSVEVNGATLEGYGKTLESTAQSMINVGKAGAAIRNLTIDGKGEFADGSKGKRGLYNAGNPAAGDVNLENLTIVGTGYTFNMYGEGDAKLVVKDCYLEGWTSFTGFDQGGATFTNCTFTVGKYYDTAISGQEYWNGCVRPYGQTRFVNCDFAEGFVIMNGEGATPSITLKDCTLNGVKITARNVAQLKADENVTIIIE